MKLYDHAFTLGFSVVSSHECTHDDWPTEEEMMRGLMARIDEIRRGVDTLVEACDAPFDTFEVEDDEDGEGA